MAAGTQKAGQMSLLLSKGIKKSGAAMFDADALVDSASRARYDYMLIC